MENLNLYMFMFLTFSLVMNFIFLVMIAYRDSRINALEDLLIKAKNALLMRAKESMAGMIVNEITTFFIRNKP